MRNKLHINFIIILSISVLIPGHAFACVSPEDRLKLKLRDLTVNQAQLKKLCVNGACQIEGDIVKLVTLKSQYDSRVAVIIESYQEHYSLTLELPSKLEQNTSVSDTVDPDVFKWEDALVKELNSLRKDGILEMDESQIENIKTLVMPGVEIIMCGQGRVILPKNSYCLDGKIEYVPNQPQTRSCGGSGAPRVDQVERLTL